MTDFRLILLDHTTYEVVNLQTQSFLNTAEIKIFCKSIAIAEFSERAVFDGTQTFTFQTHAT